MMQIYLPRFRIGVRREQMPGRSIHFGVELLGSLCGPNTDRTESTATIGDRMFIACIEIAWTERPRATRWFISILHRQCHHQKRFNCKYTRIQIVMVFRRFSSQWVVVGFYFFSFTIFNKIIKILLLHNRSNKNWMEYLLKWLGFNTSAKTVLWMNTWNNLRAWWP